MNPFEFFDDMQAKQHINLSPQAWDIIEQDIIEFKNTSPGKISGFINHILEVYLRDGLFPADITSSILNYETEQLHWLKQIPDLSATQIESIISTLKENYIQALLKSFYTTKGIGKKFDVNNACRYLLKEKGEFGYEVEVFKKRGAYINAILENYATLPMADREDIFFSDIIQELQFCIQKKQVIYVTSAFRSDELIPYKIMHDKYNMHTYLIALPYESNSYQHYLFRISQIKNITRTNLYVTSFDKNTLELLEKEIKQKGVQYLPGEAQDIKIRLTRNGINMYHRITYQRPAHEPQSLKDIENNIYTFSCTPYQAYVYFKAFGSEAEILSPPELKEDFIQFYKKGYEVYKK